MPGHYRTLAGRGEAAFAVRGSEFVGRAAPARTVEAAEAFVREADEAHPDATHNVPAYRVRVDDGSMLREWQSDDGEPSGSAGRPALGVLRREGIENAVVVVVRYFGGTELGVGGLARAYSRGAKGAIEAAGVVEEVPHERFAVTVEYDDSGTVRSVLESAGVEFEADYRERVTFEVRVPAEDAVGLCDRIRSATSGRAEIQ